MNKTTTSEPRRTAALSNAVYWPASCDLIGASNSALREQAAQLLEGGATMVQVNWEPHFRWDAHARFEELYAGLARMVEACSAFGLPVIEHHSSTCVSSRGSLGTTYGGVSFNDLACRNVRNGAPGIFRISHANVVYDCAWCCLNHPDWQQLYQEHLIRYVLPAGFEGLQHDDIHFAPGWYYCGCEHCRSKFRCIFGINLPSGDYAGWENFEDPVWRDWLLFRKMSAGDEFARIRKVMGEDKLLYGCCSVAATSLIGQHDAGYSYEDFLRGANVIYREMVVHPRHRMVRQKNYFPNWRILATDGKYFQGLSLATGCPVLNYSYPSSADDVTLIRGIANAMGQGNLWPNTQLAADGGSSLQLDPSGELVGTDEPLGIALLYSDRTAALASEDSQCSIDCFRGWCEVLLESGLPFFVIPVDLLDGVALKNLARSPLVIAPNLSCLDDRVANALRDYVADGGNLIATHETSARSDRGARRGDLALADVLGLQSCGITRQYTLPFFVEASFATEGTGWVNRRLPHLLSNVIDAPNTEVLGWVERGNCCSLLPPFPALLKHTYGKGRSLYFSSPIGQAAAEAGIRPVEGGGFSGNSIAQAASTRGSIWVDERDPQCQELMRRAIEHMSPDRWPIRVTVTPPGYFASIRKVEGAFIVHFINVGAGIIENGTLLHREVHGFPQVCGAVEILLDEIEIGPVEIAAIDRQPTSPMQITRHDTQTTLRTSFTNAPALFNVIISVNPPKDG